MKKFLFIAVLLTSQALAQKTSAYYHLDFVLKETDAGKPPSTRTYTTTAERGGNCAIRTGDKLPYRSEGKIAYIDVGVNIDCRSLAVNEDKVTIQVTAEISSVAPESQPGPPIVRQVKWSSSAVVLPLGKATTIFSSDGAAGKRQTQLELTVTPIP